MIACHECDFLHAVVPIPDGGKALCVRCGSTLYQQTKDSLDRALALNLAAFIFFILANSYPFLSLKLGGVVEENLMISGALALYQQGMQELGLLVFLTSILFPLLTISGMLYILIPLKLGHHAWNKGAVFRMVQLLIPWSLLGVFMLGVLLSVIKLMDMATIIPGVSLFSFMALMLLASAANVNLDRSVIWPHQKIDPADTASGNTARERNLLSCHSCTLLIPASQPHQPRCPRCNAAMHQRKANVLAKTWALLITAALLFIPANIYPIMTVIKFGQGEPNTIFSGVVHLIEGGMWPLALIVFFASILVPVSKLLILSMLLITIQFKSTWRQKDRTLLYRVTEVVGAWSMVDIFLIAILSALVSLGSLATILPGTGASFFAAMVIFTMLAAQSFDPRLIWD